MKSPIQKIILGISASLVLDAIFNNAKGSGRNALALPVRGQITSAFGNRILNGKPDFHNGVDIAAPVGTAIVAPAGGVVVSRYYNDIGGNQLIIKHDNGFRTGYAHLKGFTVNKGDRVRPGQKIGEVGVTGYTTGPHLHFVLVNPDGNLVDPLKFVN